MASGLSRQVVRPTIEAVILNAVAGTLAQASAAYEAKSVLAVDFVQIIQFMVYTALITAPNVLFQNFLEQRFPARTVDQRTSLKDKSNRAELPHQQVHLNVRNTVVKFLLDQSLGATTNTMLFIVLLGLIRGESRVDIQGTLYKDFWPMLLAGYRFWPFVCLVNLIVVPMEYRATVGNGAGLVWGVFMSLWQA